MNAEGGAETIRQRVVYSGHVQGVFFRATAMDLARQYGVVGFVRNVPDGTVELEAEGPAQRVEQLLSGLAERYQGHIRDVERQALAPRRDEGRFRVRY